jgi:hypothetical protein
MERAVLLGADSLIDSGKDQYREERMAGETGWIVAVERLAEEYP